MSTRTFTLKTAVRTGTMVVTETPTRVFLGLTFSRYGYFEDEPEVRRWLAEIFEPYDHDPRPLVMTNPYSGETTTVGDGWLLVEGPAPKEAAS